ncbi:anucleate primary sterigmata protein A [Metarhizium guizhouense ARSEF 977]|uniref:Anucleate primary sterigmata protein A n=1 Tax=Metarhizium guizhouense (strain ARSEF 977) TaxID=1276136 RepID=A0A0B4GP88_METGA|nr:anucleate primary sterigmata protein A [Metarhizium guizhouense ARSEF 977]
MASSLASDNRPDLPAPADGDTANDPFVTDSSSSAHHRFSNFDLELFAAGPGSSPRQAKKALEAHLAETDRRLDEAGKLGTSLVAQRKLLAERLQEVQKLQAEGELGPELRKKLVDIEREYNDLARESARVFLPKQRVPSNEAHPGSPFVPEGRSGRRSVSPSKFESQATGSPTKLSVPNRKVRNQPSNRVHDIEFAAEISTSLIAQVRNLQALLSERDDELKSAQSEKTRLEIESESLQQRLKTLDESEHRYKEENWNLETRLQEIALQQRDAADREKKLTQALNLSNSEKTSVQKELDDAKLSHSKLAEEHAAAMKHLDIELGTAKRNMVMADSERAAMQRKIDDLTNQNQELAKAFSSQRGRTTDRESLSGFSDEDFETATDNITPEHSPPPSPVKGTPRHAMLETETIKSSLHHAQRTIQSQRNQLHREKTEKLELRRIIQDLRDDLEKARGDAGAPSNSRRNRKIDSKEFKKPARLLGTLRSSKQEIMMDDPDWEDHADMLPSGPPASVFRRNVEGSHPTDTSDHFETANEASESAFETANERATETEDFQTGNEALSGDDDDNETETESASRGFGRMKRPPSLPAGLARAGSRDSFDSTASTSADEDELADLRTPTGTISSQRSRFRLNRNPFSRSSRQSSEEPNIRSSPASYTSGGTPQTAGQSLFAELQDFGSDDESLGAATPSRRSVRSATPGSVRRTMSPPPAVPNLPKVLMVDSGVMTDPVKITAEVFEEHTDRPVSMESVVHAGNRLSTTWRTSRGMDTDFSRPASMFSYSDASIQYEQDLESKLAEFPVPPTSSPHAERPAPPSLGLSHIQSQNVEPRDEITMPPTPPTLRLTSLAMEHVEPRSEPELAQPELTLSHIAAQALEPIVEPDTPRPQLTLSSVLAEAIEPLGIPPPELTISNIVAEAWEPVPEPKTETTIVAPVVPVSPQEVQAPPIDLTMSSIHVEDLEPIEQPVILPTLPRLQFSGIATQNVEPVSLPPPAQPSLALSSILMQHTQPIMEPPPPPPALALSTISAQQVEPMAPTPDSMTLPSFGFSSIEFIETHPTSPRSPWRNAFILPRDDDPEGKESSVPETPTKNIFGSITSRGKKRDITPVIAEDDTRQSPISLDASTPESQRPFKEISANTNFRPARKQSVPTSDQAAQTSLTAGAIEQLLTSDSQRSSGHVKNSSVDSVGTPDTTGTVRICRSQESLGTPIRPKGIVLNEFVHDVGTIVRPGSAASGRGSLHDAPPLPSNHRQIIEAARSGSSHSQQSANMGPPLWPASATKHRPQTPSQQGPMSSGRGTPTPRAARSGFMQNGTAEISASGRLTSHSRRSSVSSFASELDTRFNMRPGEMGMPPTGFGPNTDPRMIQAITQTMIGEFLWKYTRKTGRGEFSENRHRRYFWVHPYTRTLYWSDKDPSTAVRTELKAKSVPIEAVRVVTDDNPMPPGLHRKSLVIISPGRTIKFTCTTGQRHETWFNALSYLLLRTGQGQQTDAEEVAGQITQEDVDEFNPQVVRRPVNDAGSRAAPSLSSYNSRTTRNESPALGVSMNVPTLTPSGNRKRVITTSSRTSTGTLSKLSGYWRSGAPKLSGTLSSFRSRGASGQNWGIYEASEVHDSAEDLREMIERQDREADRLENVRACCDGKHDVGTLPHISRRGRGHPSHSHYAQSVNNTPVASMRSRA